MSRADAHAHEVPRPVLGQKLRGEFAGVLPFMPAFSDRQSADGEPIEGHFPQAGRAFAPQLGKERPLDDGKERLG